MWAASARVHGSLACWQAATNAACPVMSVTEGRPHACSESITGLLPYIGSSKHASSLLACHPPALLCSSDAPGVHLPRPQVAAYCCFCAHHGHCAGERHWQCGCGCSRPTVSCCGEPCASRKATTPDTWHAGRNENKPQQNGGICRYAHGSKLRVSAQDLKKLQSQQLNAKRTP
jgi:hypothetical protein